MKQHKTKINKGLIVLNKGERIAVISLLSLISILLAFSVFRPMLHFTEEDQQAFHNLDSLIALRKEAQPAPEHAYAPPSSSSPLKAEASRPPKKKDPSKKSEPHKATQPSEAARVIPVLELNTTDSLALVALPQIGEVMASRIQRYRDRLGGFVTIDQLYEVKGMDSARFATVRPYLQLDTTTVYKLDVNRDAFKTLLRHPYLEYDQVKAIVNHREQRGMIRNWAQLRDIVGEVNPLLERYVSY